MLSEDGSGWVGGADHIERCNMFGGDMMFQRASPLTAMMGRRHIPQQVYKAVPYRRDLPCTCGMKDVWAYCTTPSRI